MSEREREGGGRERERPPKQSLVVSVLCIYLADKKVGWQLNGYILDKDNATVLYTSAQ